MPQRIQIEKFCKGGCHHDGATTTFNGGKVMMNIWSWRKPDED
ncbi:MAG: hypothetical protein ACQUHE_01530 [Bacteroidia bacterium]